MKGVIFNVVQEVVEDAFGPDAWDEIVRRSGVDGAYTSLGSYPDAELGSLVTAAAEVAGVTEPEALVLVGRKGFARLGGRHAELLDGADSWMDVLAQLDGIIHPEVQKIYPDAEVPSFRTSSGDRTMQLRYESSRNLCPLAEGLILGLGDHFATELTVDHLEGVHRGDDSCVLEVVER